MFRAGEGWRRLCPGGTVCPRTDHDTESNFIFRSASRTSLLRISAFSLNYYFASFMAPKTAFSSHFRISFYANLSGRRFDARKCCISLTPTFWSHQMVHSGRTRFWGRKVHFGGLMSTKFPVIQTNWSHWSSFTVAQGCHRYFSEKLFVPKSIIISTKSPTRHLPDL